MLLTIQAKTTDSVNNIRTLYYYNSHFKTAHFWAVFLLLIAIKYIWFLSFILEKSFNFANSNQSKCQG